MCIYLVLVRYEMQQQTMDSFYKRLIPLVINENKKVESIINVKLHNFNTLYREVDIPFSEDRVLHIRVLKIPTFIVNNKPEYHAVFLCDIPYWRKGEVKAIHAQCRECIDSFDMNSYIIFMLGLFHGFFDPMTNINMKNYKIMIFNNTILTRKQVGIMVGCLQNYLDKRCAGVSSGEFVYGSFKQDVERLRVFSENLGLLFTPVKHQVYEVIKE